MSRRRLPRPSTAILVSLVAVFIVAASGGAALAYWRTTGSGSGASSVGTAQNVTVQAVASGTPATTLIPGGSGELLIQISNPNLYSLTLTSVALSGSVTSTGTTGCTTTGVTVATQSGLNFTLAAGTAAGAVPTVVHIPNGAAMSTASDSGCQGATFQIPVTVTVQR